MSEEYRAASKGRDCDASGDGDPENPSDDRLRGSSGRESNPRADGSSVSVANVGLAEFGISEPRLARRGKGAPTAKESTSGMVGSVANWSTAIDVMVGRAANWSTAIDVMVGSEANCVGLGPPSDVGWPASRESRLGRASRPIKLWCDAAKPDADSWFCQSLSEGADAADRVFSVVDHSGWGSLGIRTPSNGRSSL